jgi:hypothetical protein
MKQGDEREGDARAFDVIQYVMLDASFGSAFIVRVPRIATSDKDLSVNKGGLRAHTFRGIY